MKRPSLRTILLLVNLVVLLLPLGGIWALRVYESALVRQTESALIAQSAFIAATYKNALHNALVEEGAGTVARLRDLGTRLDPGMITPGDDDAPWALRAAELDLARDEVLPRPVDGMRTDERADPIAFAVGRDLTAVMDEAQRTTLAAMRVVDPSGIVIASTGKDAGLSLSHLVEIKRALTGEMVSTLRRRVSDEPTPALTSMSRGANIRVFVAMPIVDNDRVLGAVMMSRTPMNIAKAIYDQRGLFLASALVLLALVLAMSFFTAFTIRRPIEALIDQARRAVRGERGAVTPLETPVTQDVAVLSEAVARMANSLEERANYIQESMHHISHEFKTPITSIMGTLELMRDHGDSMSDEQRVRFLGNLEQDTERMERLLRSYLELAKADAIRETSGETNVVDTLQSNVAKFQALGMTIDFTPITEPLTALISNESFDTIVVNLMENARQHAGDDCKLDIVIDVALINRHRCARIRFADNGAGISKGNQQKIFQPFFTTARKAGGTGLGLALVRSLLNAYEGTIELEAADTGTVFVVTIPIKE